MQVITLRPRKNGRQFPDDIFKCIFLTENVIISIKISLKFVPKGSINNIPTLVQIMAWWWYHRRLDRLLNCFCSGADQRKHQSSTSVTFVRGIHRWPVGSSHKGPITRKMFPFDDVIMINCHWDFYCQNEEPVPYSKTIYQSVTLSLTISPCI